MQCNVSISDDLLTNHILHMKAVKSKKVKIYIAKVNQTAQESFGK